MMRIIEGAVNTPKGYKAGGKHIGIKRKRKDLSLLCSERPAVFGAMFTTNIVKAACVNWNKAIYDQGGPVRALVVNSGRANACTGVQGMQDNQAMAETTAAALGCTPEEVLVASTGLIGSLLPMDCITAGIQGLAADIDREMLSGLDAAEGIMTTDTAIKNVAVEVPLGDTVVTVAGMAKGSGMIHPNMATMLSFVTTDADIDQSLLRRTVKAIGRDTYNMISVDGDTSTNDMAIVMANGMAGNSRITEENSDYWALYEALQYVSEFLAKEVVKDGEGASKFLEVCVQGSVSHDDARKMVKSILTSNLVKTAMFGEDANWGRVLCAMGYSGADFNPDRTCLEFKAGGKSLRVIEDGLPVPFDEEYAYALLQNSEIVIDVILQEGTGKAVGWGCDLSYDYVKINGEYRS